MITSREYLRSLEKSQKTLRKRVRGYLVEQSENNVHDLRTASRRVLACIRTLPKQVRSTKRTRKFAERLEKLIRLNATVRDLDLVLARVSAHATSPDFQPLSERVAKSRKWAAKPARRFASTMKRQKTLVIGAKDLTDPDIQQRFNKLTDKLESKLRNRLPNVLRDPREKRELHRLREDARWLRYVRELASRAKPSDQIEVLREWQDLLGLIHDSDIVIDYLRGQRTSPEVQDLLREELAIRNTNYEKFASLAVKTKAFGSRETLKPESRQEASSGGS